MKRLDVGVILALVLGLYGLFNGLLYDCFANAEGLCGSNAAFAASIPGGISYMLANSLTGSETASTIANAIFWALAGYGMGMGLKRLSSIFFKRRKAG